MGAVNFYTNTNNLNVAIEADFLIDDIEDCLLWSEAINHISYVKEEMEDFIQSLPHFFWHKVVLKDGEDNGFQVYIDEQWFNLEAYSNAIVSDWEQFKYFTDADDNEIELKDCPYFKSNAVNITHFSLSKAIEREYKTLHNLLLQKSKDLGLGLIVGKSWVSKVEYGINLKPI